LDTFDSLDSIGSRHDFDDFLTLTTFYARPQAIDEYDRYKSLHPIQGALYTPLAWWRDHRNEYPTLSNMAFDFFSVPAMSAEYERVFIQAKLIMATQRQHLNAEALEAILSYVLSYGGRMPHLASACTAPKSNLNIVSKSSYPPS
jgi:hypothetical protein